MKNYPFEKLQEIALKSKDASLIYDFARLVHGADRKKLEKAIVTMPKLDPHYIYCFFRYISGSDKKAGLEAILKTGNKLYIKKYNQDILGRSPNMFQHAFPR